MKSFFVSSTFQDMQYERDIIHEKVVPSLNAIAMKYGDTIDMYDLRWGIDTDGLDVNKSEKKILDVCLNEIDRCRPYMIVLLGYRYGTIPNSESMEAIIKGKHNLKLKDTELSVTALEIEYGSFLYPELIKNTLFYFREIDGPFGEEYLEQNQEYSKKLKELKERIYTTPGAHVRSYHIRMDRPMKESLDNFANMVIQDVSQLMAAEWKKISLLNKYEIDQKKHMDLMHTLNSHFSSRSRLLKECFESIVEPKGHLFLHGVTGSGKSTLISRIGHELQNMGNKVIPIFCGYTSLCCSVFDVLKYIIWILEEECDIKEHPSEKMQSDNLKEWYEVFHELITKCERTSRAKIIFLIDGIDQLVSINVFEDLSFLSDLDSEQVIFVLSGIATGNELSGVYSKEIGMLSMEDRREVVLEILNSKHRQLPDYIIDCICIQKQSALPLYISLIVQRLLMLDKNDFDVISTNGEKQTISKYIEYLIQKCPQRIEGLAVYVLQLALNKIGGSKQSVQNQIAVLMIAISRRGLRLTDLEGMMRLIDVEWSLVDMTAFLQYLSSFFIYRTDGRIDFSHKCIKQGILDAIEDSKRYHILISKWLDTLDKNDEVRKQELCWHLYKSNEKTIFADVVSQYAFDKENLTGIAKDCASCILEDNGEWFCQVLDENKENACFLIFISFFNSHVFFDIPDSYINLIIKTKIERTLFEILKKRENGSHRFGIIWDMTIVCERLVHIYCKLESEKYLSLALEANKISISLRKEIIKHLQNLDTSKKMREHWGKESLFAGIKITSDLNDEVLEQLTNRIILETKRMIIVANKDMAKIYFQKKEYKKALEYITDSLQEREVLFRDGQGKSSFIMHEEINELIEDYCRAAEICEELGGKYYDDGEAYCKKAIKLSTEAFKTKDDDELKIRYSIASCLLSDFYKHKGGAFIDEGIRICMNCKSILERIHISLHTDESRHQLSALYNRLANLYELKGDNESKQLAVYYSKLCTKEMELITKSQQMDVLFGINKAIANLNKAVHLSQSIDESTKEISPDIINCFREATQLFDERAQHVNSNNLYDDIDDMYKKLEYVVSNCSFIDDTVRARTTLEISVKRLNILSEKISALDDEYRSLIINYAANADQMVQLHNYDEKDVPSDLLELLKATNIPSKWMLSASINRAYDILKTAMTMSKRLTNSTGSLDDYDILAVTLMKFANISAIASPEDFLGNTQELLYYANMLYQKTKREKYLQMIALGHFLRETFDKK